MVGCYEWEVLRSSEITEQCFFLGHGVSPRLFSGLPHPMHGRRPSRYKWDF
jgi:hypothetical protein